MDKRLTESLSTNRLIGFIEPELLAKIIGDMEQISVDKGEMIFKEGDTADAYYIVLRGTVEIVKGDAVIENLPMGQGFGEMALLNNQPRSADARAQTDVKLAKVSRAGFTKITQTEPRLAQKLYELNLVRLRKLLLLATVRNIFGDGVEEVINSISDSVVWETFQTGDVVFRQGDIGQDLLIVIVGRLVATYDDGFESRVLGEIGTASFVGESALLQDKPRGATVTAIRETTVVRINRENFDKLISQSPAFARRIMGTIVERQQQNIDENFVHKPTSLNFGIVPVAGLEEVHAILKKLVPELALHGSVFVADRETFDDNFGIENVVETVPKTLLRQWLTDLEQENKFIVLVADEEWSPWTQWVSENSDRIVVIADAKDNPTPGELEKQVVDHSQNQHVELILLQEPEVKMPSGTTHWLDGRNVYRHFHLRKDDQSHYARVARLLTGNGIGIVFGGGGARGYAHIGIIQAIMESNIPVDAIGSVSMGAVIGGGWLVSMQHEDQLEWMQQQLETYGSKKMLLDMTVPVSAVMRSKKVTVAMHNVMGDIDIEDCWLPFYCVSTNLSQASVNIHRRGKLHQAVRASLSIPGVFSPVVRDGDLTIDGGVMNNFPVDLMRQYLEGGTIIGSLIKSGGTGRPYEIDDYIDGIPTLLSRFVPWMKRRRVPSIMKTILASSSVNAYMSQARYRLQTDLLLETDTYPYSIMDFDHPRELTKMGYENHQTTIDDWANELLSTIQSHAYEDNKNKVKMMV